MTTNPKKVLNKVKTAFEQQQGPAQKDQSTVPFADAIRRYWEEDLLTFSIPAHNGGRGPKPEFTKWAGEQVARADLPVTHGIDTRNSAYGVQSTAQQLFAEAVGARQTLFSTNGSSLSVHVAMMSVAGPGDTIVLARNGHKSAFAGLIITGARPVYVEPYYDQELELAHPVTPAGVSNALEAHPGACAVMVFTPSYYGTSADIRTLAECAHRHELPLITDDAWGLDYAFGDHPELPPSALSQGADLVIGSVHKTLTGLSQTSVLSLGSERVDAQRLQLCFELEESTSSSTLLLSSIDGARAQFVRDGKSLIARGVASAHLLRDRLASEVPELTVVDTARLAAPPGVTAVDPMHVLIETGGIGLTGYSAVDWLRQNRHIDVELVDHRRLMPLISFAHGEQEVDRLVRVLRDLVDAHDGEDQLPSFPPAPAIRSETAMLPRDAFFAQTEMVSHRQATGRVSAELVTPYPPGIPAVAPGEVYTQENLDYLQEFVKIGGFVEGATDTTLEKLRVVAN